MTDLTAADVERARLLLLETLEGYGYDQLVFGGEPYRLPGAIADLDRALALVLAADRKAHAVDVGEPGQDDVEAVDRAITGANGDLPSGWSAHEGEARAALAVMRERYAARLMSHRAIDILAEHWGGRGDAMAALAAYVIGPQTPEADGAKPGAFGIPGYHPHSSIFGGLSNETAHENLAGTLAVAKDAPTWSGAFMISDVAILAAVKEHRAMAARAEKAEAVIMSHVEAAESAIRCRDEAEAERGALALERGKLLIQLEAAQEHAQKAEAKVERLTKERDEAVCKMQAADAQIVVMLAAHESQKALLAAEQRLRRGFETELSEEQRKREAAEALLTAEQELRRAFAAAVESVLKKERDRDCDLANLYTAIRDLRTKPVVPDAVRELVEAVRVFKDTEEPIATGAAYDRMMEEALPMAEAALADAERAGAQNDGLRPEVRVFARAMEARLRANDHKPGWRDEDPDALLDRLRDETEELDASVNMGIPSKSAILAEAADVANFALMVADVCGALAADAERAEPFKRQCAAGHVIASASPSCYHPDCHTNATVTERAEPMVEAHPWPEPMPPHPPTDSLQEVARAQDEYVRSVCEVAKRRIETLEARGAAKGGES